MTKSGLTLLHFKATEKEREDEKKKLREFRKRKVDGSDLAFEPLPKVSKAKDLLLFQKNAVRSSGKFSNKQQILEPRYRVTVFGDFHVTQILNLVILGGELWQTKTSQ